MDTVTVNELALYAALFLCTAVGWLFGSITTKKNSSDKVKQLLKDGYAHQVLRIWGPVRATELAMLIHDGKRTTELLDRYDVEDGIKS
jgi:Asp/Glu/hydantoin racemase